MNSSDTKFYTPRGWKFLEDAEIGDEVLSINPDTLKLKWARTVKIHSCYYKKMIHFHKDKIVDLLASEDHRVFYKPSAGSPWQFVKAGSLLAQRVDGEMDCVNEGCFYGTYFDLGGHIDLKGFEKVRFRKIPLNGVMAELVDYNDIAYHIRLDGNHSFLSNRNKKTVWSGDFQN